MPPEDEKQPSPAERQAVVSWIDTELRRRHPRESEPAPTARRLTNQEYEAGGFRNTEPARYEANLRAIMKRLKTTDAKPVWASTTPIRALSSKVFEPGSEIEYNLIGAKIMKSNKVELNDMYTHVRDLIDMDKPASHGADPCYFDRKPIHQPLVERSRRALEIDPPESFQNSNLNP